MTAKYGFKPSFNPSFAVPDSPTGWWVTPYHFGIDQGPVALMIENHRTGLLWDVMRRCARWWSACAAPALLGGGCSFGLLDARPGAPFRAGRRRSKLGMTLHGRVWCYPGDGVANIPAKMTLSAAARRSPSPYQAPIGAATGAVIGRHRQFQGAPAGKRC